MKKNKIKCVWTDERMDKENIVHIVNGIICEY